jgi:hypothetical protein
LTGGRVCNVVYRKIVFLYDLYDLNSDEEVRERFGIAPRSMIRFLRSYMKETSEFRYQLTYQERRALMQHRDLVVALLHSENTDDFQRVLCASATRKFVRVWLYPLLRGDPKMALDDDADDSSVEDNNSDSDDSTVSHKRSESAGEASAVEESLSPELDNDDVHQSGPPSQDQSMGTHGFETEEEDGDHNYLEEGPEDEDGDVRSESADEGEGRLKRWPAMESLNTMDQSGGKNFGIECKLCHKTFPRMSKYANHMNTHTSYEAMPYKCRGCGRSYASSWTLGRHERKCISSM